MRSIAVGWLLLGWVAAAAPGQEKEEPEGVWRTYEASQLLGAPAGEPAPVLGFGVLDSLPRPEPDSSLDERAGDGAVDDVTERVKWLVPGVTELWIGRERGQVQVRAPAATQPKVAWLLRGIASRRSRRVRLELVRYRGDAAAADALLAGGPVLDAARLKTLSKAWQLVARQRLGARCGTWTHLAETERRGLLHGLTARGLPVTRPLMLGRVDAVRPALSDDGRELLVALRTDAARAAEQTECFDCGRARLDQPRVSRRSLDAVLWLPAGGAVVAGLQGVGEHVEVTVVRHRAHAPLAAPAQPSAPEGKLVGLWDSRFTCFPCPDASAPALGVHRGEPPGRGGAWIGAKAARRAEVVSLPELVEAMGDAVDDDHESLGGAIDGVLAGRGASSTLERLGRAFRSKERRLDNAASYLVRVRLLAGADRRLVEDLALVTLPWRRSVACRTVARPIVTGYANGAPRVARLRTGTALAVRATPGTDDVTLSLDVAHEQLEALRVVDVRGGRAQLPRTRGVARRLTLEIAPGGSASLRLGDDLHLRVDLAASTRPRGRDE